MPPSRSHRGGGGSHLATNPDTDDSTPTVSGHGVSAAHAAAIFATSDQGLTKCVRHTHRARIHRFIKFLFENYGDIYELCTCIVSPEDRANPELFYTDKDIRDLTYSGLDPIYFLAFLSDVKTKANGKLSSFSHMSKFYDAIKYGSKISNKLLSVEFYSNVDTFLFCYKKEFAEAKKEGNTDEKKADTINSALFELLLQWAINEGNFFVWCFALLMWHLMARSSKGALYMIY